MDELFLVHPATPEGAGGIAVIELYGAPAARALSGLFRPRGGRLPAEGEVRLGSFSDGGGPLDEALLAAFPASASWCRLPGWALSIHGGPLLWRRVREALLAAGGREAEREEVLRLAVSRGALSSLEADALALLPHCQTARACRFLLRMSLGELPARLLAAREALGQRDLTAARSVLESLLEAFGPARRLLHPLRLLLAGRPNAGKSALFNRLLERERAAVTPVPGTTRDLLEEMVVIAGYPVVLIDGAGLRPEGESTDPVEREGMRRVREARFDAALYLLDHPGSPSRDEEAFLARMSSGSVLIVRAKADLRTAAERGRPAGPREAGWISSLTGEGLDRLRERIREEWLGPPEGEEVPPAVFTAAQAEAVAAALDAASVDAMERALLAPGLKGP